MLFGQTLTKSVGPVTTKQMSDCEPVNKRYIMREQIKRVYECWKNALIKIYPATLEKLQTDNFIWTNNTGITLPYTSSVDMGQFAITINTKKAEVNKDIDQKIFDMPGK